MLSFFTKECFYMVQNDFKYYFLELETEGDQSESRLIHIPSALLRKNFSWKPKMPFFSVKHRSFQVNTHKCLKYVDQYNLVK